MPVEADAVVSSIEPASVAENSAARSTNVEGDRPHNKVKQLSELERDVQRSSALYYENAKRRALWELNEFEIEILGTKKDQIGKSAAELDEAAKNYLKNLPSKTGTAYDDAVPTENEIGMNKLEDVSWYDLGGHLDNKIRSKIRSAYRSIRQKNRKSVLSHASDLAATSLEQLEDGSNATGSGFGEGVKIAEEATDDLAAQIASSFEEARDQTRSAISNSFFLAFLLRLLFTIAFVFICLRSFLYVFARVAFAKGSEAFVTLKTKTTPIKTRGTVKSFGPEYVIDQDSEVEFYVSRKFQPKGTAPMYSIPQPGATFLSRVRHGSWSMNRIPATEKASDVRLTTTKGAEFIEWTIREGEVVVFDYKNFVGFSREIKLASIISWRLSSLMFGRIIFPSASGPGKLLLRTSGRPVLGDSEHANTSVPVSQLVAWMQDASFTVVSELNYVDVYLSGAYLKKQPDDMVVLDADEVGKAGSGIVQFVKHFLLPA